MTSVNTILNRYANGSPIAGMIKGTYTQEERQKFKEKYETRKGQMVQLPDCKEMHNSFIPKVLVSSSSGQIKHCQGLCQYNGFHVLQLSGCR